MAKLRFIFGLLFSSDDLVKHMATMFDNRRKVMASYKEKLELRKKLTQVNSELKDHKASYDHTRFDLESAYRLDLEE